MKTTGPVPKKFVIENAAICACPEGPNRFKFVDIDDRTRCTNCDNLAPDPRVPKVVTTSPVPASVPVFPVSELFVQFLTFMRTQAA